MSQTTTAEEALRTPERSKQPNGSENREGERLDEARAEFRAAWARKVTEKRRQAAWARMRAASLQRVSREILLAGLLLGAILGPGAFPGAPGFPRFLEVVLLGATLGFVFVIPLLGLTQGGAGANRKKADRLEDAARELERQVDCSEFRGLNLPHDASPVAGTGETSSRAALLDTADRSFEDARTEFRAAWSAKLAGQ